MATYVPTIGLEIHAELKTQTKMFCDSLNDPNAEEPNTNICPVCMGHPGTLPVANKKAIEEVLRVGYALNCTVADISKFDRKNYFYPDLPKGYQISQYDMPFCEEGYIELPGSGTRVRIERIHLEEDAGRLSHRATAESLAHGKDGAASFVDFNRAGVPLMELVTYPDMHSAEEARLFAEELRRTLRYLDVSDAEMEHGQMRVEVNLSLAKKGVKTLGTKVEMKNLNSFRVVQDAVAYEIDRQTALLEEGERVVQETRGWDEAKKQTFSQRSKEEAHDYRYFPEPDLPAIHLTKENGFDLRELEKSLPELPSEKRERFAKNYPLSDTRLNLLLDSVRESETYERLMSNIGGTAEKEVATEYFFNELRALEEELGGGGGGVTPKQFSGFVEAVISGGLSSTITRPLLRRIYESDDDPKDLLRSGEFQQAGEEELTRAVGEVIAEQTGPVEEYKKGKTQVLQFLVGQVMAKTKGKANPARAQELLEKELRT